MFMERSPEKLFEEAYKANSIDNYIHIVVKLCSNNRPLDRVVETGKLVKQ
jgi:hypothetical protein